MPESSQFLSDVALLAPVPAEHLDFALETCLNQGKVAFGSGAFEVFIKLNDLAKGLPCDVLIYASGIVTGQPPAATWRARYINMVHSNHGAHPDGMTFRPSSTAKYPQDNLGHWAVFWEVTDLERLATGKALPISKLRSVGSKSNLKPAPPRGPIVIDNPF